MMTEFLFLGGVSL